MIFFEEKTLCDCEELLFDGSKNYLIQCSKTKGQCPNCHQIYTKEQVEF